MAKQYTGFLSQVRSNRRLLSSYQKYDKRIFNINSAYDDSFIRINSVYDFFIRYFSGRRFESVNASSDRVKYLFSMAFINTFVSEFHLFRANCGAHAPERHTHSNTFAQYEIASVINIMSVVFPSKMLFVTSIARYIGGEVFPINIKGRKCYIVYLNDVFIYNSPIHEMRATVFHTQCAGLGCHKDKFICYKVEGNYDDFLSPFTYIKAMRSIPDQQISYYNMISLNSINLREEQPLVHKYLFAYDYVFENIVIKSNKPYAAKVSQVLSDMYKQYFKPHLQKLNIADDTYMFYVTYIAKVSDMIVFDVVLTFSRGTHEYSIEEMKQMAYDILQNMLGTNSAHVKVHNNFIRHSTDPYIRCTIKFTMVVNDDELLLSFSDGVF
jgi:hypothetical protein